MSGKSRKDMVEARRCRENAQHVLELAMKALVALPNGDEKKRLVSLLRRYVINNNCSLIVTPENPISPEHKLLIRDDCNGNISNIVGEYLSPEYLAALKRKKTKRDKMYGTAMYRQALNDSIYRQEMFGYKSYAAIEYPLLVNLMSNGISPDVIAKMNISDFRSFVKDFCYDEFVKYREKEGFVKVFIRENEQDFYTLLRDNGVHPAYVDRLIENMHTKGCADSFEFEYKGQIITGPGFSIDHKNPVYCPNNIASYPEVNDPNSLAMVENNIHRLKHKLERRVEMEDGIIGYEKILLPQYCAAMLDFEHYVVHDFNQPNRKIIPSPAHGNNLVHLNKIETFINNLDLQNSSQRGKTAATYINKNGGRK